MRFTVCFIVLALAFGSQAAPLGNANCDLALLKTAANMEAANDAVDTMAAIAMKTNDAAMADAVNEAQGGLTAASGAFQGIAAAIPDEIAAKAAGNGLGAKGLQGLTDAKAALDTIKAARGSAARGPLTKAKAKIMEALGNAQQVAQCSDDAAVDAGMAEQTNTASAEVTATASATSTATATAAASGTTDAATHDTAVVNVHHTATAATAGTTDAATHDAAVVNDHQAVNSEDTGVATDATAQSATISKHTKNQALKSEKRQLLKAIGGIGCNVARVQILANLRASSKAVAALSTAAAADATAADAATTASAGLASAKAGIATIAKGIIAGQSAAPDARKQVEDGLTQAQTALAGITSTDPAVTDAVAAAAGKVDKTIAAGQKVVAKC